MTNRRALVKFPGSSLNLRRFSTFYAVLTPHRLKYIFRFCAYSYSSAQTSKNNHFPHKKESNTLFLTTRTAGRTQGRPGGAKTPSRTKNSRAIPRNTRFIAARMAKIKHFRNRKSCKLITCRILEK